MVTGPRGQQDSITIHKHAVLTVALKLTASQVFKLEFSADIWTKLFCLFCCHYTVFSDFFSQVSYKQQNMSYRADCQSGNCCVDLLLLRGVITQHYNILWWFQQTSTQLPQHAATAVSRREIDKMHPGQLPHRSPLHESRCVLPVSK